MRSTIGASIIHWVLAYYLGVHLDMKMTGVAIASMVHFIFRFIFMYYLVTNNKDAQKCLISLRHEDSWKGLKEIIIVGWNSFLVKVMGWWAFDVFTQLASLLTETDVAAQTILRNIGLFTYMIPVGLMISTNYLVGRYIGMNRVDLANKIGKLLIGLTLTWSLSSMILVFIWREPIMSVYTTDESIKEVMRNAWNVVCVFVFFDCMQGVANGAISGLGIVKQVRWVTIVDYWVLGIPLSMYCMFKANMGIQGLWYGPTLAVLMNYLFYQKVILGADMQKISDETAERMKKENAELK